MNRYSMSAAIAGASLVLAACGGGDGTDGGGPSQPRIPASHTIQLPMTSGPAVSGVYDEDSELTGLMVGETAVGLNQRISGVSGGGGREVVGPVLQSGEVIVRHVTDHWNRRTDAVAAFEFMSFGAWATGTTESLPGGGAEFNFQSIGSAYLTALDDARTPNAEMPASGTASYLGQFTGFVQAHGTDVDIRRTTGDVEMTADFANAETTVDMLSTRGSRLVLSGAIQGSEFSGTAIDQMSPSSLIESQGATARFSGGFYGTAAVEAGGVFEVVGGRAQDPGRLVGAFGGRKDQ